MRRPTRSRISMSLSKLIFQNGALVSTTHLAHTKSHNASTHSTIPLASQCNSLNTSSGSIDFPIFIESMAQSLILPPLKDSGCTILVLSRDNFETRHRAIRIQV
ncbi:hypothetical protein H5410_003439 [Solanum commersonii]|uniref:Uncharacterized protein n=1 Tax=Solanum commersonii TaxID=4109 RepID=A0A9J6B536_SOLCO|nr:hypothetical protein H5410_003439 [Solanum commersonii]